MFFVAGITGKVGGAAARKLLQDGQTVRGLVRDPHKAEAWSRQGVDVRLGDLNDSAAVAAALEGVEGAFLMVPPFIAPAPGLPESKAIIASLREAVRSAPPERLVVLSSIGSEQTSGLGLITATHLLEQALGDLAFPTAFVRAGGFLENYAFSVKTAAATGWLDSFMVPTGRSLPMVATQDIGNEVARLLTEEWTGTRVIELGTAASPDDIARAMSEALARPVQARPVPREKWTATLEAMGLPAGRTWAYEEMEDSFNSGWIHFGVPGTEQVAATITLAAFFEHLAGASS